MLDTKCFTNSGNEEFLALPLLADISGETVHTWRKRVLLRQIPYVKFGRNVRVRRSDFEQWVAERMVPSAA